MSNRDFALILPGILMSTCGLCLIVPAAMMTATERDASNTTLRAVQLVVMATPLIGLVTLAISLLLARVFGPQWLWLNVIVLCLYLLVVVGGTAASGVPV